MKSFNRLLVPNFVNILLVITLSLNLIAGCGTTKKKDTPPSQSTQKEEPQKVNPNIAAAEKTFNTYFQLIREGKQKNAYDLLTSSVQKIYSKEDYALYIELIQKVSPIKSITILESKESNYTALKGKYPEVSVKYRITYDDPQTQKTEVSISYVLVTKEKGTWRLHDVHGGIKEKIPNLAYYAAFSRSAPLPDKNAVKYLKLAIQYDKDFMEPYLALASIYYNNQKSNLALPYLKTFLAKTKDNMAKAEGYHLMGLIYYWERNNESAAKGYFQKALKLNPNHEQAKNYLDDYK